MATIAFIINIGSSSRRYALYKNGVCCAHIYVRKTYETHELVDIEHDITHMIVIGIDQYAQSLEHVLKACITHGLLDITASINAIGIRIVAPGSYFLPTQEITQEYIHILESTIRYAPLHIIPVIDDIKVCKRMCPFVPLFGVSDSAFHASMPERARVYGITKADTYNEDIFRFGYHGISVASVIRQLTQMCNGLLPTKVVVCHLGSGCSITAVKDSQSIDTSMGYSPNEGLVMATRSGSINMSAYLKIKDVHNWDDTQMILYLDQECGLLGLSGGESSDIEILVEQEKKHKQESMVADIFIYNIVKTIGSHVVALNGIDALIFTGGIGEHNFQVRSRIIHHLSVFDFALNEEKNTQCKSSSFLQKNDQKSSKKLIAMVESQEMQEIFLAIEKLI